VLWENDVTRPIGLLRSVRVVGECLTFAASLASGRLGWAEEAWRAITTGTAHGVSIIVTNRHSKNNGRFSDYVIHEVTVCVPGANAAAQITDAWQERCSSSFRLRYDAEHPRIAKTIYIEGGEVIATPHTVSYMD